MQFKGQIVPSIITCCLFNGELTVHIGFVSQERDLDDTNKEKCLVLLRPFGPTFVVVTVVDS